MDTWLWDLPLFIQYPAYASKKDKVKDFWTEAGWDLNKLYVKLSCRCGSGNQFSPFSHKHPDFACWKLTPNGSFSTKNLPGK